MDAARLFELSADLLATLDASGTLTSLSPSWERTLGWPRDALLGSSALDWIHPDDRKPTLRLHTVAKEPDAEIHEFENRFRCLDGSYRWLQWNVRRADGNWYAIARDVTARKLLEQHAVVDLLTGLLNRAGITDRIAEAIARLRRQPGVVGALLIDLDHFHSINTGFGHDAGDTYLQAVGRVLSESVREIDALGRSGGDEFVVLLEHCLSPAEVVMVARRTLAALQAPILIEGDELSVGASVGVAVSTSGHIAAETLLREADIAVYRAKAKGGNCYEVFDSNARADVERRMRDERDLRQAVDGSQLILHYQPIVALPELSVSRYEALVRWQHPTRGLLAPDEFIPLAEETGVIVAIGTWVLEESCRQASQWRRAGWDIGITVNVSARQLERTAFVEVVRTALSRAALPAGALCLEITETGIVEHPQLVAPSLRELSRLGVRIAIDDFGSGYSSLTHLEQLPLDTIKIDKSFVAGILDRPEDRAIVAAILSLARETEMSVIAEGVESEALHSQLLSLGCEFAQGFLYDAPRPAQELSLDGYSARVTPGVGDPLVIREFMRQIGIPARIQVA